jgi:pilus assembly protein FimV
MMVFCLFPLRFSGWQVGKFASKFLLLMTVGLLLPSLACAAGLGKLTVLSALGQPLNAEIEIVALQAGEYDGLSAKLASLDAFRQASIDVNPALLNVKFAIEQRSGGKYVLTLTSKQAMNEPFVDMLVELGSANGRLVREYTFLLDPPEYAAPSAPAPAPQAVQAPLVAPVAVPAVAPAQAAAAETAAPVAPAVSAPTGPAESTASSPTVAVVPVLPVPAGSTQATPAAAEPQQVQAMPAEAPQQPASAPVPAEAPAAPPAAGLVQEPGVSGTYEVKRGDTLSRIANQNPVDGATLQQMLVALFRANQDAFVGDNMNRLRAGKIINIPDKDSVAAVSASDARRIVTAQFADFNDYKKSLGTAVAAAPTPQESGRQASGQIGAPKEEKPAPAKEPSKDQLRLSSAEDAKKGGKAAAAVTADDAAAKSNALKEANERIALLQKNLDDMQKLEQLKSGAGAKLQQQAEAAKAAQPAGKPAEVPAKPAVPAAEAPKAAEPAKTPVPAKAPEATTPAPAAAVATKAPDAAKAPEPAKAADAAKSPEAPKAPEAAKAPEAPKTPDAAKAPEAARGDAAKAAPKPAPQPEVEVGFFDDLLNSPATLGGAGGAVLLLAGYFVYAWRKKRGTHFENSIMSSTPSDGNSVLGTDGGRNVDTGSSSFQSDFSQGGIGKADAEEIDPIAEADVYMAYGRDAQAEEILKEALAKDSSRQSVRVKLLEIYANRKDTGSFQAVATELHEATNGQGPEWEKVAGLGLSIDPTNALYGGTAGAETAAAPALDTESTQQVAAAPNLDFDIGGVPSMAPPPDFNLDAGAPAQADAAPSGLDFDLGLGGQKPAEAAAPAPVETAPAADAGLSIDFNLPGSDAPAAPVIETAPAAPAPADSGGIDFDLNISGAGEAAPGPAAAPALDLGGISLDLGMPSGNGNGSGGATPDPRWQEVATKLDLAKAYEEMGDKDGARELLKEVVKEGDTAQQQQAQTMLQALG